MGKQHHQPPTVADWQQWKQLARELRAVGPPSDPLHIGGPERQLRTRAANAIDHLLGLVRESVHGKPQP